MWAVVPTVRFIQYGLGSIGIGIAELALARGHRIAGAFDIDPAKVGQPLSTLLRHPAAPAEVRIASPDATALAVHADVALHSTQSRLSQVRSQLESLIDLGVHVISTCEELAFPWHHHSGDAAALNERAHARGVAVVGLGVNPGFVMDVLPVVLTSPCHAITGITVQRIVDVGRRRRPLQQKVGVGLTVDAFREGVAAGRLAHVGLPESVAMIADAMGWTLGAIDETIDPVVGTDRRVVGLHQRCRGMRDGAAAITLDLTMAVGAKDQRDTVAVDADPPLRLELPGGVQGDQATCAIVVNAIPQILAAPPGLRVATELPPRAPALRSLPG